MPRTTTSRRHGAVVPLAIAVAFRRWTILRVLSNCKGLRITFYSVRHLRLLSLSPSQGPSRRNRTLAMRPGGAFLEIAGARALDWRPRASRPAGVGGAYVNEQARLPRAVGVVVGRDNGTGPVSTPSKG